MPLKRCQKRSFKLFTVKMLNPRMSQSRPFVSMYTVDRSVGRSVGSLVGWLVVVQRKEEADDLLSLTHL
uniref:Uncharacterized protein n=1 Tax=Vespula pensylvanica TaxID=30213 RepID=A0A834UEZ8_VESPE|nr:hypothetical protein H0235_003755 [Vespula pensylvanica]